ETRIRQSRGSTGIAGFSDNRRFSSTHSCDATAAKLSATLDISILMKPFLRYLRILTACGAVLCLASRQARAQFVINGNSNTPQTVSSGTGLVTTNGNLTITSGSTAAVTMTGTSILTNLGTVAQTGTGRGVDNNVAGANLSVFNGSNALIKST